MKVLANILQTSKQAFPGKGKGKSLKASRPAATGNVAKVAGKEAQTGYNSLVTAALRKQAKEVASQSGLVMQQDLGDLGKGSAKQVLQLNKKNLNNGTAVKEGTAEALALAAEQITTLEQNSDGQVNDPANCGVVIINGQGKGKGTGQFLDLTHAQAVTGKPEKSAPNSTDKVQIATTQVTQIDRVVDQSGTNANKGSQASDIGPHVAKVELPEQASQRAVDVLTALAAGENPGKGKEGAVTTPVNTVETGQTVAANVDPGAVNPPVNTVETGQTVAANVDPGAVNTPANTMKTEPTVTENVDLGAVNTPANTVKTAQTVVENVDLGAVNNTVKEAQALAASGAYSQASGTKSHSEPTTNKVRTAVEHFGRLELSTQQANRQSGLNNKGGVKAEAQLQQNISNLLGEATQNQAEGLQQALQANQAQQFATGGAVLSGQGNITEQVLEEVSEAPVVSQIAQAFRAGNARTDGQIVINLNPPELGKVRLEFASQGKELRAVLRVDNPKTMAELQQEAPALVERLGQSGVEVKRIEVVLNNQTSTDSSYAELQEDHRGRRQEYAEGYTDSYGDEIAGDSDELVAVGQSAYMQNEVSDNSINVWM